VILTKYRLLLGANILGLVKAVIFNVGEIAPKGRFYALRGRFCDLPNLGGNFSFQGGDFCRLECTKTLNWFQK